MKTTRVAVVAMALALVLVSKSAYGRLQCMGEGGNAVDWWAAVKTPIESASNDPNVATGTAYAYTDAVMNAKSLVLTGESLATDKSSSLWSTLAQVYGSSQNSVGYMMFNDETPSGAKSGTKAHQKGVVAFDGDGGFWLIHSVPRFPNTYADGYEGFPANEDKYGQSFLCISFSLSSINDVGALLYMSRPNVYDSNLPSSFNLPNIAAVIAGDYNSTAGYVVKTMTSVGGAQFTAFSKNRQWDMDLYEDLVAPTLGSDLYVESWQNGVGKLPTYCRPQYPYNVYNIATMAVGTPSGGEIMWKETQDHSKWAVTVTDQFVCIGGINRQHGQRVRGGGTLCHNSPSLFAAFNSSIQTIEPCQ
ncbi:deoxyribonuclease II family protein [Thecamonas trahens ATCC 50062]|uniref:Deoxyribonuclease II family protein n=1 Tax=Thecamonas trahens ATCC 50062 TaxID=461836 RepID=A0A0L0D5A5_THETB|nr:deoxyribonuclease II family protein [Thecamonas trahens ATCC 50062]KNC46493.1 deoxyribonuclease II family protein [Thecamonas trahens ATCC 50062]|eukprot:XP_013760274.1 deoxyribonuclease II family protein [Thecamonas trahens ATCC 50062]